MRCLLSVASSTGVLCAGTWSTAACGCAGALRLGVHSCRTFCASAGVGSGGLRTERANVRYNMCLSMSIRSAWKEFGSSSRR